MSSFATIAAAVIFLATYLIVAYRAANRGIRIGFWEYFKVGAPLTLATLLIGLLWL